MKYSKLFFPLLFVLAACSPGDNPPGAGEDEPRVEKNDPEVRQDALETDEADTLVIEDSSGLERKRVPNED